MACHGLHPGIGHRQQRRLWGARTVSFCSASSASTSAAMRSSDSCPESCCAPVTASDGCIAVTTAAALSRFSPPSSSAAVEQSLSRDSWRGVLLSSPAYSTSCTMPTRLMQPASAAR